MWPSCPAPTTASVRPPPRSSPASAPTSPSPTSPSRPTDHDDPHRSDRLPHPAGAGPGRHDRRGRGPRAPRASPSRPTCPTPTSPARIFDVAEAALGPVVDPGQQRQRLAQGLLRPAGSNEVGWANSAHDRRRPSTPSSSSTPAAARSMIAELARRHRAPRRPAGAGSSASPPAARWASPARCPTARPRRRSRTTRWRRRSSWPTTASPPTSSTRRSPTPAGSPTPCARSSPQSHDHVHVAMPARGRRGHRLALHRRRPPRHRQHPPPPLTRTPRSCGTYCEKTTR